MRTATRRLAWLAVVLALALVAAACGNDDGTAETTTTAATGETTTTTAAATTTTTEAMMEIATDVGVTAEPCPDGNPDRGCIYLGIITDETNVFAAAGVPLVAAHRAFWARVNEAGGIGGAYDVALPDQYKVNANYTPATHVEVYAEIHNDVLALAESLGTSQTLAALPDMESDTMVAAPASWWSGWAFDDQDGGLVLESGSNYCVDAMNATDWALQAVPEMATVGVVFIPNDYGKDFAAGVAAAAAANNLELVLNQPTIPISLGGDEAQTEAVTAVVSADPDVTFLVTGPRETGAIVGGSAALGHTKPFIGAGPTWDAGLLQSAAAPAFTAGLYFNVAPWGPWGADTPGHAASRELADSLGVPPTIYFTAGWALQYPLKAALEKAYENGDLTRAGLKAAADSLTSVDYEGMLPEGAGNYAAADPADRIVRQSVISKVDAGAPGGLVIQQDFFEGPTVKAYDFSAPCAAP